MDVHTEPGSNSFLSHLFAFCVDSFSACFSRDSDKLCVLLGLGSLSALALLLSRLLSAFQRCRYREEAPAEQTALLLYCFLGDLCSAVGAGLCTELHIQVLMAGFSAALDAVSVMCSCFPVNTQTERRLRVMRRRRRQHLLAVCVLMMVAGGFMKSPVRPADGRPDRRRLLHTSLPDNTEILGYVLGSISFVIICTSRFPLVCRVYRGQMLTQAHMFSGLLCSLAGGLYAAVILLHDTQVLLRVVPWLLTAICGVTLDLLVSAFNSFFLGLSRAGVQLPEPRAVARAAVPREIWGGTRLQLRRSSPDTERLLGGPGFSTEQSVVLKNHSAQKLNSSRQTKSTFSAKKKTVQTSELGRYMDVCLQEARDKGLDGPGRGIRAERFCLSDTSFDSSTVSSDLEWDFEEANVQWRGPTTKLQEGDEFPLQLCPANPKPFLCQVWTPE